MKVRTLHPFWFFGFPFLKPTQRAVLQEPELQRLSRSLEQTSERRDVNQDRQPLTAIPQRLVSNRCAAWQLRSPENREPTDSRVALSRAALPPCPPSLTAPPSPNSPNSPTLCPCSLPPSSPPHRGPLTGNLVPRM